MTDYNVQFPDGTPLTIQTGTINNTYDIPLVGQDAINYGDDFATAYIRLLANFSNTSAPTFGTTRTTGQLWYDSTPVTGGLNVYDGTGWDSIALDANVVHTTGAETISGIKTFSSASDFTAAGSPFTVNSTTTVANLSAELLDGNASTAFASAFQGTLADGAEPDLLLPPIDGYVLSSDTGGTRMWISPAVGTGNVDPWDVSNFGTPATTNILLSDDPTGDQQPGTDADLSYDATGNTLSCPNFLGNLTGNATTASNATLAATATTSQQILIDSVDGDSGDTAMYPVLVPANTATDQAPHTDVGQLSYNATSGTLFSTVFSGSGTSITNLNMANASAGVLVAARGGTGVTTSEGHGSSTAVILNREPTFVNFITVPLINNTTSVTLQYNGANSLSTRDPTASGFNSAATIIDGDATSRSIGFNVMDTDDFASSAGVTLFDQTKCGHSFRSTHSSGNKIYQSEATIVDIPIPLGSMWVVRNLSTSTGTVTIQGGTGSTLRNYDGSGGTPPETVASANPFTLARGGVATIVKVADSEYEMWGIGLTGGA